jgi:hypothetical protein
MKQIKFLIRWNYLQIRKNTELSILIRRSIYSTNIYIQRIIKFIAITNIANEIFALNAIDIKKLQKNVARFKIEKFR